MTRVLNGSFDQTKIGFAQYLNRWRSNIYPDHVDTKAVKAFLAKPFDEAVKWVPSRMIDEVESMLATYRKNENGPDKKTTLYPVVLLAIDDNFLATGSDWGGQQISRRLVQIEEGGSCYGYKHVMQDRRVQVVVIASEGGTAQSLAAQLTSFVAEPQNRYLLAPYIFGQYTVPMPITLETNRIDWMDIKLDGIKNMKVLAADFTLKCTVPYFDAPGPGDPNDGSANVPQGFPLVNTVEQLNMVSGVKSTGTSAGIEWGRFR